MGEQLKTQQTLTNNGLCFFSGPGMNLAAAFCASSVKKQFLQLYRWGEISEW